jgi:hypothetical protein
MRNEMRHTLPRGELACAGGLLATGAFVVIYGLRYPLISDGVVGPGLMPMMSGLALAGASAALVWKALRGTTAGAANAAQADVAQADVTQDGGASDADLSLSDFSEDEGGVSGKPATVVGILALLLLTALLAPVFGLIPMLGLLVFVCVLVFEREGLLAAVLMTAGCMAVSWLLFGLLFEVPMPPGSFWRAMGF